MFKKEENHKKAGILNTAVRPAKKGEYCELAITQGQHYKVFSFRFQRMLNKTKPLTGLLGV